MKNILIPIDFSDCANEALEVGIQLARRFEAKVHLYHMIEGIQVRPLAETDVPAEIRLTRRSLEDIQQRYPDLESISSCLEGKALQESIRKYVGEHSIDLIVMGSHGASGKSEYFIGSHTQKVVRTVRCPVLVIKEAPKELNFDTVVYASAFNENEKEAFLRFKAFIRHFIPDIHLVAIHTSTLFEAPYIVTREAMEEYKDLCHPFTCKVHIYKDFTIEHGIRTFAEDLGAKLIAISNHFRHPVKRMLIGSNVEALINHADIPVLTIDYPEENR